MNCLVGSLAVRVRPSADRSVGRTCVRFFGPLDGGCCIVSGPPPARPLPARQAADQTGNRRRRVCLSFCFLTSITMTPPLSEIRSSFFSESHLVEQMPHFVAEWLYFFG